MCREIYFFCVPPSDSIPVKVRIDGCRYHLRNPANGKLLQKPWTILTTDGNMKELEAVCSKHHRQTEAHDTIQGSSLTASTSFYPPAMVDMYGPRWSDASYHSRVEAPTTPHTLKTYHSKVDCVSKVEPEAY